MLLLPETAETKTMLPVIEAFMTAHRLPDVTVVADAGMISETNRKEIEAAGLSFHPRHARPRAIFLEFQYRVV
jgi:transposase